MDIARLNSFHCSVVSLNGKIFEGDIKMIQAQGALGSFAILAGHEPFLTTLTPGPLKLSLNDGTETVVYTSGGYLEVISSNVMVLADETLRSDELDEQTILAHKKQAEEVASKIDPITDPNYTAMLAQIAQMAAQLRTIQAIKKIKNK